MDQLEQEVHELREEVTTLRAEVEKLTNLVSSLTVQRKPPASMHATTSTTMSAIEHSTFSTIGSSTARHTESCSENTGWSNPHEIYGSAPRTARKEVGTNQGASLVPERLPTGYKADLTCVFHQEAPGHDIEHYFALKKMDQKLIEAYLLSFEDPNLGKQINSVPEQYQQQPWEQALQQFNPQKHAPRTKFDPIPIKYAEFLPTFLERN